MLVGIEMHEATKRLTLSEIVDILKFLCRESARRSIWLNNRGGI